VQAQEKIRNANILLVSIKALANEIAKNLVLAGIGAITLADHEVVVEEDLGAQFLVSDSDVGKNVRSTIQCTNMRSAPKLPRLRSRSSTRASRSTSLRTMSATSPTPTSTPPSISS
jgi:molybdopterin/thiamine biosynthesis adenylyltransferase